VDEIEFAPLPDAVEYRMRFRENNAVPTDLRNLHAPVDRTKESDRAGYQTKTLIVTNPQTSVPLYLAPLREIDATNSTAQQNIPQKYAIAGDVIILSPIPAGVYTIQHRYYKTPPLLVADGDLPVTASQFRSAIVTFATHLAFMRANEANRAASALDEYKGWLKVMNDAKTRSTEPGRIYVRPGGWV
jgi:hypothetical protein